MMLNRFRRKASQLFRAAAPAQTQALAPDGDFRNQHFLDLGPCDHVVDEARQLVPLQTLQRASAPSKGGLIVQNRKQDTLVPSTFTSIAAGDAKMKVTFTDPMTSDCFIAQVPPSKTAAECIQALKSNGMLGPGSYHLVANGNTLPPSQSLGDAGVTEGAQVSILKMETGA